MVIVDLSADRSATHRSLQVISEVKCVVRELVENAIDAGATDIVIKLVDHGSTAISVSDNAKGIQESNFEKLALRNTTSKIQNFEDIFTSLNSHGFRGEALNSIANVGALEVETRMAQDEMGWALKYRSDGTLEEKTRRAAKVGTNVTCRNLFEPYPVRRNMLLKGLKSQTTGAVAIVQQYALIHPEIRFSLANMSSKNHQMQSLFSSSGTCKSVREVAGEVFGHNFIKHVLDVYISNESWDVKGIISTPQTGRQSNDIQVLFVNRRPVDGMKKIRRCIKDIHKQFSSKYNVAYILNINIDAKQVDVNLAPDKRRLFVMQEERIVQQLKEGITELYMMKIASDSLLDDPLRLKQLQFSSGNSGESMDVPDDLSGPTAGSSLESSKNRAPAFQSAGSIITEDLGNKSLPSLSLASTTPQQGKANVSLAVIDNYFKPSEKVPGGLLGYNTCSVGTPTMQGDGTANVAKHGDNALADECHLDAPTQETLVTPLSNHDESFRVVSYNSSGDPGSEYTLYGYHDDRQETFDDVDCLDVLTGTLNAIEALPGEEKQLRAETQHTQIDYYLDSCVTGDLAVKSPMVSMDAKEKVQPESYGILAGNFSFGNCARVIESPRSGDLFPCDPEDDNIGTKTNLSTPRLGFVDTKWPKGGITPFTLSTDILSYNDVMVLNMDRVFDDHFCKEHTQQPGCHESNGVCNQDGKIRIDPKVFLKMKVCGQFNQGFIIAKLAGEKNKDGEVQYSVYLIDPHAADEKAKFEQYNANVAIHKQPLVCPRRIDLSPFHQQVVQANLELLNDNGFSVIVVSKDEEPTREAGVYLGSFPQLMGQILGEEDFVSFVHELAKNGHIPQPGTAASEMPKVLWGTKTIMPRPKRIWSILANRACKDAVKLGEPLSMKQMVVIKDRLAGLIHPWNCPHGRPTMKCLITTDQINRIIHS
ncbi:DNA mismatch repair protein [Babesia ovis]|uniref:DNA mismatch repair protein n=1 Tax=Babesia ovis TaxID=5869 RepID=A0A9W5TE98_BABOV|nr:DNA mismatch repair protein [Babesia ovis]